MCNYILLTFTCGHKYPQFDTICRDVRDQFLATRGRWTQSFPKCFRSRLHSRHSHFSAAQALKDPEPLHYNDLGGADFYSPPLRDDGSDHPCKGYYLTDWGASVAQWPAGGAGTFTIDLLGVAAHHGDSCQASISYDAGRAFKVLKSFIGDCPRGAVENTLHTTEQTFDFPIPANAPRGSAIFA
ncbi:hypothetical protein HOY80DRAFT_1001602 [Tuber brumale]|nr:hypothetical protein HOY80DRAFT_1001602 [Tuber brumale]